MVSIIRWLLLLLAVNGPVCAAENECDSDGPDTTPFRLEINFDTYYECLDRLSWSLFNVNLSEDDLIITKRYDEGNYYDSAITETACLDSSECFKFFFEDDYGLGLSDSYYQGYYEVYFDNHLVHQGGEFEYYDGPFLFGNGCASSAPSMAATTGTPTKSHRPSTPPTTTPSAKPSSPPSESFEPSLRPSTRLQPSMESSPTTSPTSSPTTLPSIAPTFSPTSSLTSSPTSLPTSSPSIAPTSSPTTSPTSSPSIAPTTAPTSSPTMTPPKLNSWYIANNGNATEEVTSKDIITIFLPINSTNRDTDALVFTKDCITPFSPNLFEADTTSPTSLQADGYIQFNTTLKMNVTAINRTTYWTPYADGTRGGWVEVCAETDLNFEDNSALGNGPVKTKVDFINNILNISVSLTANYEVNEVSAQREEATKEDVNTDYSEFITAYECDDTDLKNEKAATTYNQGDEITICVTDKSDEIVQVEEFVNLVVAQGGNNDYNFIRNGQWNPDITTPVCVDSNTSSHRVCYATIRAIARFFSTESPAALTIRGSVYVRRDGRRVKQILRSALPTTENNNEEDAIYDSSRRVQENPGSGDFEVKVGLTSTDNSVSSACTVGGTDAGLMSVVVGAAGVTAAALMV